MRVSRWIITTLVCALTTSVALAKDPPADLCSLLTTAQLEKTLGVRFAAPEKTVAPAPFMNIPPGAQCEYKAEGRSSIKVSFIAYADPSPAVAKQTFDRLSMWYAPKSKPKVGDAAYFDKDDAIHVLKGRVRYFISIESAGSSEGSPYMPWASRGSAANPAKEKVIEELAVAVAGKL